MTNDFLQRFIAAQEPVYQQVLHELKQGKKVSHWMWFIFPQLRGLGLSDMAYEYGIPDVETAKAYIRHPILGQRLLECSGLLLKCSDTSIHHILGSPDDMKLRSCMTLFAHTATASPVFLEVLIKYFDGQMDDLTLLMLHPE